MTQSCTDQVLSTPVSPNASVSKIHIVHVPDGFPVNPSTARFMRLYVMSPTGNVPTGNALTVTPLCSSVPRRIERYEWLPAISSLVADESLPITVTVRLVHAVPSSIVGRVGVAEPDQRGDVATVIEAFTVWVADVPAPVIVNDVVPNAGVSVAVSVRVALPPAVTVAGLKVPVTPVGRPETDSAMLCETPTAIVVLMV